MNLSSLWLLALTLLLAYLAFILIYPSSSPVVSSDSSNPNPNPVAPAEPSELPSEKKVTVEDVMKTYFELLNKHDFDHAYRFLSPSWGVDPQEFKHYWSQFAKGSVEVGVGIIRPHGEKSFTVGIRLKGIKNKKKIEAHLQCVLTSAGEDLLIERCE